MPHVIVKMTPGRSEAKKQALADEITQSVMKYTNVPATGVSVDIQVVDEKDWKSKVYDVDITPIMDKLYVKPDYDPN